MTMIVILNVVFSALIVAAILSLLVWGIVTNRTMAATLADGTRTRVGEAVSRDRARVRATRPARRRLGRALDLGA
jgi:hypothetical protein